RRRALEAIDLEQVRSNGYSFQIEMTHKLWRQGLRVVEVPIIFTDRFQGHSKMSGHIVREALLMVWRLLFQNKLSRRPRGPEKAAVVDGSASASRADVEAPKETKKEPPRN